MDPVLIVGGVALALVASPWIIKEATAFTINAISKRRDADKIIKTQKITKKEESGNQISQSIRRVQNIVFTNTRTNQPETVRISEDAEFNEGEEILLKGRLHITAPNGAKTVQDIYLFQPRVFSGNVQIGPKLDGLGHISDKYTYLCRMKGQSDILTGYLPKREIFSGMRFDFVKDCSHSFVDRNPEFRSFNKQDQGKAKILENYIYIDIPKDNNGNYIPVDLSNVDELKAFRSYIERHRKSHEKTGVSPGEYFQNELGKAQESLRKHIQDIDPVYVERTKKINETKNEVIKVESAKKAEKSIDEYYQRYNYYLNPLFGERYNQYDGHYNTPYHQGMHHHEHHHTHR